MLMKRQGGKIWPWRPVERLWRLTQTMKMKKTGSKDCYAIDSNRNAIECTKINTQILDMTDSVKSGRMDLVESIKNNETEKVLRDLK